MNKILLVFGLMLMALLLPLPAVASTATHEQPIIGVLAVPSIFTYTAEVTETPTMPIYEAPNVAAPIVAIASKNQVTSSSATDVYLPEVGHEETGFDVLAKHDGWYQVLLRRAGAEDDVVPPPLTGWVLPPADAIYTPLADFLGSALLDFTALWDGNLYDAAGSDTALALPPLGDNAERVTGADVLAAKEIGSVLWVHVRLRRLCSDDENSYGTGWVPLPADWRLLLSHYSRGC